MHKLSLGVVCGLCVIAGKKAKRGETLQSSGVGRGASSTARDASMAMTKSRKFNFWTETISLWRAPFARYASRRKLAPRSASTDTRVASEELPLGFPGLNARSLRGKRSLATRVVRLAARDGRI